MYSINNALGPILVVALSLAVTSINCSSLVKTRIAGGKDAELGQFPYQIAIRRIVHGGFVLSCGGAIISEKFVLTAGQCVFERNLEKLIIIIGGFTEYDGQEYTIKEVIIHEHFNKGNLKNDIALVQLSKSIEFSTTVAPIPLGREFIDGNVTALLSGFGAVNDDEELPANLNYEYLDVMTNKDCHHMAPTFAPVHDPETLCVFTDVGQGICAGDGGTPLVYNNTLIGIASWGPDPCHYDGPTGFTRISEYIRWIVQNMATAA